MKILRLTSLLLFFLLGFAMMATAQDGVGDTSSTAASESTLSPEIQAFLDAFDRVEDVGKLEVVQTTLDVDVASLEPFYLKVINYVADNSSQVLVNSEIHDMALAVFPRIIEGGFDGFSDRLWILFDEIEETYWRIAVLEVIGSVSNRDEQMAVNLSSWLNGQNQSKRAGTRPDFQVVLAAVRALGNFTSQVIYPVLLDTVLSQYSADITASALVPLASYEDLASLLVDALEKEQTAVKRDLYNLYLNQPEFAGVISDVSFQVLNHVLDERPNNLEERLILDSIRLDAVRVISLDPSSDYAPALIKHFNSAIQSYDRGTADKGLVLEAIGALGKTDSTAAAVRLAEFLDLMNTYTELDKPYDRQITLAVINNLKNLGKIEAYNALYMVTVLNYSNYVQDAAREALAAVSQ